MKLMKLCAGLLFLAVAALPACRGDNKTMDAADVGPTTLTPAPLTAVAPLNTTATAADATEPTPTLWMPWDPMQNVTVAKKTEGADLNTTSHATSSADAKNGGGGPRVTTTTVSSSTTAAFADLPPATDASEVDGSPSWGYVLLVFIILAIIILLVVLYLLRRSSKSYSFDLHRAGPSADLGEPIGTFEPVYLDDLDRPAPTDQDGDDDLSIPPEVDNTVLPLENGAAEDPQEQLEPNGLSNVGDAEQTPDQQSPDPEAPGEQQSAADLLGDEPTNENNNNPSQTFVEINLDEPAWCDQLLASPDGAASSSVLPFSFPLTTTSSSSSPPPS